MPIWISRKRVSRVAPLALVIFVSGCGLAAVRVPNCDYRELPRIKTAHPYVYGASGYEWTVTVDELEGTVRVESVTDKTQACSIDLSAVRYVYAGAGALVLRSVEIDSDDLFFFNPKSCGEVRKAVHLGVGPHSEQTTPERLNELHICPALR